MYMIFYHCIEIGLPLWQLFRIALVLIFDDCSIVILLYLPETYLVSPEPF